MFSTPDGSRRGVKRAASARRSLGASSRHGTPASAAGATPRKTPRAPSVSQGYDASPVGSIRRGKSSYSLAGQQEAEQRVLVRNEALTVDVWADLPSEVQEYVLHTDLYTNAFRSSVQPDVGYAYLVGRDTCWVWSVARRHQAATAFSFPCPKAATGSAAAFFTPAPYATLLPTAKGREPALLLVGAGGEARFWQAVSMGLSGTRFATAQIPLGADEVIKAVLTISKSLLLVSTSTSRIFRLALQSVGGQTSIRIGAQALDLRAASGMWRFLPSWGSSGVVSATDGVFSLALSRSSDSRSAFVWALEKDSIACLDVGVDSGERLRGQAAGLANLLAPHVGGSAAESIQVLDFDVSSDEEIALLASVSQSEGKSNTAVASNYFLIMLSSNVAQLDRPQAKLELSVSYARQLNYSALPDLRPLSHPTLKLIAGGPLAYVQFPDAVVCTSTAKRSIFEEAIPLKSNAGDARNRFFGAAELSSGLLTELTAVSALSGILRIRLSETAKVLEPEEAGEMEMISVADAETASRVSTIGGEAGKRQTKKLKARLEQAVYFGEAEQNPLAFGAAIDDTGADVGKAALEVSDGILASSSEHLEEIIDTRVQLHTRVSRLQALAIVLHERGLYNKTPQSIRRQLMWNAEKLAAASAVWQAHNASLSSNPGHESILVTAIDDLNSASGRESSQDPVRDFLRFDVNEMEELLRALLHLAETARLEEVHVAVGVASVIITVLHAAQQFRNDANSIGLYGIDQNQLPLEPWTCRVQLVDGLLALFERLQRTLRTLEKDASQEPASAAVREAVDGLADHLLEALKERIEYLAASRKDASALHKLLEKFDAVRPAVIRALVDVGKPARAYQVAERFDDHRSLVELATNPSSGSEQQVQLYIEKFGKRFAFPLYNYYVEKGQARALLTQPEVYGGLVQAYLEQADLPRLSWLHDVASNHFDAAAHTLLAEGPKANMIAEQHTMLSLSKLAYLATLPSRDVIDNEETAQAREVFDDRLDFTISQLDIKNYCQQILDAQNVPNAASVDVQAKTVSNTLTTGIEDRHAFQLLYQSFIRRLLRGIALSPEDMMDLYSLSDPDADASRLIQALQLFLRSQPTLPRGRADMALDSIWRRAYLATNWSAFRQARAGASDEDIASQLRSTPLFKLLAFVADPVNRPHYEGLIRQPADALFTASRDTFNARYDTSSTQEHETLWGDYEYERDVLKEAIDEHNLETCFAEVSRLAVEGDNAEGEMQV